MGEGSAASVGRAHGRVRWSLFGFGVVIPVLGIWADLTLFAFLDGTNVELVGAAWRIPRPTCLYVPIWTGIGAIALWLTVGPRLRGMKRDALAGLLVVTALFDVAFAITAFRRMFILSAALPAVGASIGAYLLLRDALARSENRIATGPTLAWAFASLATPPARFEMLLGTDLLWRIEEAPAPWRTVKW